MASTEKEYLTKFYALLRDNLLREKSLKASSVLISFLETRSAGRFSILSKSTIHSSVIPEEILLSLVASKKVQPLSNVSDYAITAKGVWEYEKDMGLLTEDALLNYINTKFFSESFPTLGVKCKLEEKEDVILLAMIAARAFSPKSSVDTKKNEATKGRWQEVLERSFDLLNKLGMIKKLQKEDFLGQKGNEHIVSYVFRHNNEMLKKTNGIYAYTGKQEYYLNLYKDGRFAKEELNFIFWKLFNGELAAENIDTVLNFCNEISKDSIFLFDMTEHIFSQPAYDMIVKDALLESLVSKTRWSNLT